MALVGGFKENWVAGGGCPHLSLATEELKERKSSGRPKTSREVGSDSSKHDNWTSQALPCFPKERQAGTRRFPYTAGSPF